MAKATAKTAETRYVLTLSEKEARELMHILMKRIDWEEDFAGDTAQAIYDALGDEGCREAYED